MDTITTIKNTFAGKTLLITGGTGSSRLQD